MAGGGGNSRSLEQTPTWAVAIFCLVLVIISIIIEHAIHLVGKWFKKRHRMALYEALEKIKSELMLMGFISLLLTVLQSHISKICVPKSVGNSWHPCKPTDEDEHEDVEGDKCLEKGKVSLISSDGVHQLHIFIFVLAVSHILYCITTMALGRLKMRRWKTWELETRTAEYEFSHDPSRFRFARETSFGRRHLSFWSKSPILIWIACFFRQFVRSVPKVDYLTLRHGFIAAHLDPQISNKFDFQKYIKRSLEEDLKVVVGISPAIWFSAVIFLLTSIHGWRSYLWLPFISVIIILLVGTKLQVTITKMAIRIMERGDVVKGVPVVRPGDDLFWFNSPRLLLFLIHFLLFQNAFQLAFLAWSWYEFGYPSCFHQTIEDIIIRISVGILIQVLSSYVTLPLYALVTQMGSHMKPTIFNERVATALRHWHQTARKQLKENGRNRSVSTIPLSISRSATPTHGLSPAHLLHYSGHISPGRYVVDEPDDLEGSPSPSDGGRYDLEAVRQAKVLEVEEVSIGGGQAQAAAYGFPPDTSFSFGQ